MKWSFYLAFALTLTFAISATILHSQETIVTAQQPTLRATYIDISPDINGDVLNDAVWQNIPPSQGMTQVQPNAGTAASERTELRIAYDDKTLYVSAVLYDSNPSGIVVTDARRDGDLSATDAILFILDPYHDSQNGFVFGTNSVGTQYDAQVDNEGIGNFNNNRQ